MTDPLVRADMYFTLPRAADVRVRMLDLQGRLVATLADKRVALDHAPLRFPPRW